ncbi:MAG: formate dehydrogenase accessory sulfurtransferase FdhD [Stomatobaculum sp.]|nr:formate dehydrogenase accessory sulfurtransferase FdhD [Stomatobaculum sp.]
MEIRETGILRPGYRKVPVRTEDLSGGQKDELRYVPEEYRLSVRALPDEGRENIPAPGGQEQLLEFCCTPSFLPEMVLGHLLTEGLISGAEDVVRLEIFRDRGEASVLLRPGLPQRSGEMPLPALQVRPEWISALEEKTREETELRAATRAVHSAILSHLGNIVFTAEDIGRHNAIDKAAGFALRNAVPLGECLLYTTGRMPSDMVMKAVRAGIPVMVSGKGPTSEGLLLAKQYGLTLIGNVRNGRRTLY